MASSLVGVLDNGVQCPQGVDAGGVVLQEMRRVVPQGSAGEQRSGGADAGSESLMLKWVVVASGIAAFGVGLILLMPFLARLVAAYWDWAEDFLDRRF